MTDILHPLAVRNSAKWCDLVCKAHGLATTFTDELWICHGQPPRFYPAAATLLPFAQSAVQTAAPQFGFKDGFNDVDGHALGYTELLHAHWICHVTATSRKPTLEWQRIETDESLRIWERAWAGGDRNVSRYPRQFPPSLLANTDIAFMAGLQDGEIKAGCILFLTKPVVGFSNQFGNAWSDYPRITSAIHPGCPIVGYERGHDLQQAQAADFISLAPLKVWVPRP